MARGSSSFRESLDDSTQAVTVKAARPEVRVFGLTILCHQDPRRVGEVAPLPELLAGKRLGLSRLEPQFAQPGSEERRPLAHRRLSRKPFWLSLEADGGVSLECGESSIGLIADGQPLETTLRFSEAEVEAGVVLLLAERVTLLLHVLEAVIHRPESLGMVGESAAIVQVRLEIERVADLPYAVLLVGESGTGKELAARAICDASQRKEEAFVPVNIGAIPSSLASAELFGASKGAYTGADSDRQGYFQRASGGTLFLDEIGETPLDVQVMLLRALESGQIQPVGARKPVKVDVRFISATDRNLENAIKFGKFLSPLLYRLSNYTIQLPPLRERREDIGRLFFHFLRREMEVVGEEDGLGYADSDSRPWMSAELMSRLAAYEWPGNVRQLQNVVRELAVSSRGHAEVQRVPKIEQLLGGQGLLSSGVQAPVSTPAPTPVPVKAPRYRDPDEVGAEELTAALAMHRYVVNKTAAYLDISRSSFYKLMEKHGIRKAGELRREEIERSWFRTRGRLEEMVDDLKVSKKGLKDRMKELGLR